MKVQDGVGQYYYQLPVISIESSSVFTTKEVSQRVVVS